MLAFFIPRFRTNCLIASGTIPLSLKDCNDQSRGSFHPIYSPDFTAVFPFDFDSFIPSIAAMPL